MTRAKLRAFKCRNGVHRYLVGWYLGGTTLKNAYCRDCPAVRVPTGKEPRISRRA